MPPPPPRPPASTAAAAAAAADSRAAVLSSVNTLASYSDTLADFLDQWNSIVLDVASIAATFAVLFPGPGSNPKPYLPDPEPQPQPVPAPGPDGEPEPTLASQPEPEPNAAPVPAPEPQPHWEREPSPLPEPQFSPLPVPQSSPLPEPQFSTLPEPAPAPNPDRERKYYGGDAAAAELEHRCKQMNCRGLRRLVTAHVRDGGGEWLRQVGPAALRRAPDAAALVLRAVGRYYIRAESPHAEAACTLLLELYVRAGCPRLRGQGRDAAEQLLLWQEAREAALTWRSRLLRFGGAAGPAGARGLALFIAAFGVPVEFPAQELCELVDAADVSACIDVLKTSKLFVKKMRDVVIEMINKAMYLQAMRLILAFEFQEAFPLAPTLALIIEKLEHDKKDESEGQASERDEEDLALLRSISKCMEDHKLSPSEFTSFAAKIALLEERVGKPKQAYTGVKRKRAEECVE